MDGPGEHYAEWNKPVRGRQVSCDLTRMWKLMNKNSLIKEMETLSSAVHFIFLFTSVVVRTKAICFLLDGAYLSA